MQVACFQVGRNFYALDIMTVKEVINPPAITSLPHAPSFVEGIIELRGTFLPVIDLRKRFGIELLAQDYKIVVAMMGGRQVGLVVDAIDEVSRIDPTMVQPTPDIAVGPKSRFFIGLVKLGERVVVLLDVEQILSGEEHDQLAGMSLS